MEDDSGVPSSRGRGRPTHREVYERLQVQVAELRDRMGGLPLPEEAEGIWRSIWYEEAHHSTALEGNTLVLKQVQQLLDEGRAVGDKELREYMEVRGYADAAEWIYQQGIHPQGLSGHGKIRLLGLPAAAHCEASPQRSVQHNCGHEGESLWVAYRWYRCLLGLPGASSAL